MRMISRRSCSGASSGTGTAAGKTPIDRYPRSFFLVHAAEHGVEHRTEIKMALAQMGVETPDLDGWYYCGAAGHGQPVG